MSFELISPGRKIDYIGLDRLLRSLGILLVLHPSRRCLHGILRIPSIQQTSRQLSRSSESLDDNLAWPDLERSNKLIGELPVGEGDSSWEVSMN